MYGNPLPFGHLPLINNRPERCGKPAAEAGRGFERHLIGQAYEVDVGIVNGHELGKGAPVREAGLKLVITNLLVAGMTFRALATTPDKWNGDPITHLPPRNALTYDLNDAGQLMPRNMGQHDVRVISLPAVPVAAANAARHDPQNYAAVTRHRVRYLLNLGRRRESPVDQGFHLVCVLAGQR